MTTQTDTRATVIRGRDMPELDRGGVLVSPLASPEHGSEFLILRGRVPKTLEFPAHSHDRQEVLLITSGAAEATLGDERTTVGTGDAIVIPAGLVHSFASTADEILEGIGITPAGTRTFLPSGEQLPIHGES